MNANTTASIFPDSWYDLWELDRPLDFDAFLESDLLAARRKELQTDFFIFLTSGSLSFIASSCLIWHILRSYHGLSTTYHRLVFGLSIADFMGSFVIALSSIFVPKELNYLVPHASGNTVTCSVQGFIITVGGCFAAAYNCSICCYYLAIIRYNKKDEYIKHKLEPWFHGISIVFPLVLGFSLLATEGYNEDGSSSITCYLSPNNPPHCIGYENGVTPEGFSIPCGRGDGEHILSMISSILGYLFLLIVTPFVIIGTMLLNYRSVTKIEKKMQKYGVNALRLAAARGNDDNDEANSSANEGRIVDRIKNTFKRMIPCLRRDDQPASRSNSVTSQKRAILYVAFSYALAWGFVFIPIMTIKFVTVSSVTESLVAAVSPLQGLFTFIVYMSPQVRNAKRSKKENLTWLQACVKAFVSKGERRRTGRNTRSNTTTSRSSKSWSARGFFNRLTASRASKTSSSRIAKQGHQEDKLLLSKQATNHLKNEEEKTAEEKGPYRVEK